MSDLEEVVASTDLHLSARKARCPAYEAESNALRHLSAEMTRNPEGVLAALCRQVLLVCGAESAGVSILMDEDADQFQWPVIAGLWSEFQGGGMPRTASPCGLVIRADRSLLFHDVVKQFPAAAVGSPAIAEILLAPFRVDGKPIGTVWAIMHSDAKRFDREDQRLLESLAQFAGAAYAMTSAADAATKARQELSLVNLELAHRLKNLLAVVAAIASSSLRTVTPRIDVATFNSRIRALAAAQDMLIGEARGVADLSALASSVAGNLCDSNQIEISGPPLAVGPSAALSLSLILHELVTNALKYGALSTSNGRASFVWSITEDDPPKIEARWEERGGPIVEAPHQKGFGTRLISMGLIGQGDAQVFFRPEGLQVALSAPLCAVTEQSPHAIGKA